MAAAKIIDEEREFLEVLMEHDPKAEYAINLLHYGFGKLVNKVGIPATYQIISNLRRRKLIGAEGRGKFVTFWIEDKGREALKAAQDA